MPINIASYIQPAGGGTFPLVEDKYILGGSRTVANTTERDAIPANNRKAGMTVVTSDTMRTWKLAADLTSWVSVSDKDLGMLDLSLYITDFTGVTDQTAQLAAAEAYAYTNVKTLYHPGGKILSGPIEFRVPVVGLPTNNIASTRGRSVFLSTVTNGGKAFYINNSSTGCYFENITFLGSGVTGSGTAQNAIGLSLGEYDVLPPESHSVRRGLLRNVLLKGWALGGQLVGWLNNYDNLWVTDCDLGLKLQQANGCVIDIICENNKQDFIIDTTAGATFLRLQLEGAYGNAPSLIDNCDGIAICSIYLEQPNRTAPWIIVGSTIECNDIHIRSGIVSNTGAGISPIQFDKVSCFSCDAHFYTSASGTTFSTTDTSYNYSGTFPSIEAGYPSTTRAGGFQANALNVFPNPYMLGTRWGINTVDIGGANRASFSKEITNTRTCNSALRITPTVGQNSNYLSFRIGDAATVNSLKGKVITFGCWIYVPPLASMAPETVNYKIPGITIQGKLNGTAVGSQYTSVAGYHIVGAWNFFSVVHPALDTSCDEIGVNFYVNNSSNLAEAGEYIIVDCAFVAEGRCAAQMFEGKVVNSPINPVLERNGQLIMRATTAFFSTANRWWQDPEQYYEVNDKIEYTNPVAGGYSGKVCTTAGAGSASVWKNYGFIETT